MSACSAARTVSRQATRSDLHRPRCRLFAELTIPSQASCSQAASIDQESPSVVKIFGRLGLEFEIAVRIGSDVPVAGAAFNAETIAPHIDGVCAAIELVDDRDADYTRLDVLSLVADNSWNAGIVLSEFAGKWPDPGGVRGHATRDRASIGEGHGRDILGHPFNSVAWLASQLASRGIGLKAGEIVMTGSVMKTVFPTEDAHYRFDLDKIGFVEVQVR